MYHQAFRYGVHAATHLSLGLPFLGAGCFTLGTSNVAIACMITTFFPRFHHVSSDNKSSLRQQLRHLWVLAAEPRRHDERREREWRHAAHLSDTDTGLWKLVSIRIDTPRYWPFCCGL